ncbi:MAG: S41 family peptidase [Bacteroidetes bacterium]|nr:MAG: S41 family peptidase [Bacteroidota bacterium]
MNRKTLISIIAGICLLSVGFITQTDDNFVEISKNLEIFGRLYRELNASYVDDPNPNRLMRTGIDAMLHSLDPYTTFIGEDEAEDIRFMSTGEYGGVGALVGKRDKKIQIIEIYEGYPADQAGLRPGDQIVKIDSTIIGPEKAVADVRKMLRGDQGLMVTVEVLRSGLDKTLRVNLIREQVKVNNVPYFGMVQDKIGYIALTGFTQDAGIELEKALRSLRAAHPQMTGVILDLRDNPGGRLDEAVRVANAFLPQNELIVETRGRIEGSHRALTAPYLPVDARIPLVVLVNGRSASASEIVAGAIQDLDRGVILGQRSFGKGLVQNIRPLSYNTQLKVTTAKYYTPSGRCIQAINYAERNEDGSVGRIPDSLRTAYQTRNQRTVYDGGGIEPDVRIEAPPLKTITRELERQGIFFDFVSRYAQTRSSIPAASLFVLGDGDYQEFVTYVQGRDFSYETPADKELEELRSLLKAEQASGAVESELDNLARKLQQQKDLDLNKNRAEIGQMLTREIVRRYHYRRGLIEVSLNNDPEIAAAIEVLSDPQRYGTILNYKN